ncbi:hypothetical protein MAJ_10957, partial [Metarhizium majus ARSEF 297]
MCAERHPVKIAFTAWVQRRNAYNFTKEIQDVWDEQHRGPVPPRASTSPLAARASMDLRSSQAHHREPWSSASLDRDPTGHFRDSEQDISEAAIADKSKANALAKAIVCLQATWFVIQCLVRLTQDVPISLLELYTFAHALCALIIYGLWWRKPLDIEKPTLIDDESAHGICAFLCCLSTFDDICDGQRLDFDETPLMSRAGLEPFGNRNSQFLTSRRGPPTGAEQLEHGQYIPGTGIQGYIGSYFGRNKSFCYYPRDLRRWKLAYSAWESNRPELESIIQQPILTVNKPNIHHETVKADKAIKEVDEVDCVDSVLP